MDKDVFDLILNQLIDVLGSDKQARLWLDTPALALDGNKPVELLHSEEGIKAVQTLIIRMDYGVYC
jgi:putative toxin-antitoxin system antitoxin component (TIGR02293 family)